MEHHNSLENTPHFLSFRLWEGKPGERAKTNPDGPDVHLCWIPLLTFEMRGKLFFYQRKVQALYGWHRVRKEVGIGHFINGAIITRTARGLSSKPSARGYVTFRLYWHSLWCLVSIVFYVLNHVDGKTQSSHILHKRHSQTWFIRACPEHRRCLLYRVQFLSLKRTANLLNGRGSLEPPQGSRF